jgi:hypothetical protein
VRRVFDQFEAGTKTTEYRRAGAIWNDQTCRVGRRVTLSRGYGKQRRLHGVITGFAYDKRPEELPGWTACYGTEPGSGLHHHPTRSKHHTMNHDEALAKIRKLLGTQGRTDAEADTAQILAAALAEKHGIDLEDAARPEAEQTTVIIHRVVGQWGKVPIEATYASLICKRFFDVQQLEQGRALYDELLLDWQRASCDHRRVRFRLPAEPIPPCLDPAADQVERPHRLHVLGL